MQHLQQYHQHQDKQSKTRLLKKIENLSEHLHQFVIVDLDTKEIVGSSKTLHEIAIKDRCINTSNRKTSLKITERKLKELTNT